MTDEVPDTGIEPRTSCLPSERANHYATPAGYSALTPRGDFLELLVNYCN